MYSLPPRLSPGANGSRRPAAGTRLRAHQRVPPGNRSPLEVATGQLHELDGHTGGATSLAYSPDGKVLATAAHDGSLILWTARRENSFARFTLAEEPYSTARANGFRQRGILDLAFAPDGKTIASANHDGTVRLSTPPPERGPRPAGTRQGVRGVAFSPDGKTLHLQ